MNASCLDEKGRFKSCPYRVYTDEHKAILRGQGDFVSHILDGTLLPWLASWKMKSQMLVAFLLENEKARLSEKD